MIDLLPLEDGLRKPVQSAVQKKQAEGGDHGYQPEIPRCEEPSQDDGGDHLDGEPQALGNHRDPGATHREAPEPAAIRVGPEYAAPVEGLHRSSRRVASGSAMMASRKVVQTGCITLNAASVRL